MIAEATATIENTAFQGADSSKKGLIASEKMRGTSCPAFIYA